MEFVCECVKDVPLRKRQTQWKLATLMGVSKTTVQHWIVASTICVHSNSLKPILTEENKLARLLMDNHFCNPQDPSKDQDMCDRIHWMRNGSSLPEKRSATSLSQTRRTQSVVLNTNLTSQR